MSALEGNSDILILIITDNSETGSVSSMSLSTVSGSPSKKKGATPTKIVTAPFINKGKLYFPNREAVPVLTVPDSFDFYPARCYLNNQAGLKEIFLAKHDSATKGVGFGILKSTGTGNVFIDSGVIDEDSEIIIGTKITKAQMEEMFESEPSTPADDNHDENFVEGPTCAI